MITCEEDIKCSRCEGFQAGYIYDTETNTVSQCPDCYAERMIIRMLQRSGVAIGQYTAKTLENFQVDTDNQRQMKNTAKAFLERFKGNETPMGIGFFGRAGTGKTHICIATCLELTKMLKKPHYYFAYRTEIQKLKSVMYSDSFSFDEMMKKWANADVLYIDDLFKGAGKEDGIQQQDIQIMFDLINSRYINKKITIFSSEWTVKELLKIDEAIGSRIYEIVKPFGVLCNGDNYRLK